MKLVCLSETCHKTGIPFIYPEGTSYKKEKCRFCKGNLAVAQIEKMPPSKDPNLDIRGDRIEPDEGKDGNKVCIYCALAAALYKHGTGQSWKNVIAETVPLRKIYPISFDEDAWTPALAEFYGFKRIEVAVKYDRVLPKCLEIHTKQLPQSTVMTQFFVVGIAVKGGKSASGHAIYVEYLTNGKATNYKVIDNEATQNTKKIANKLSDQNFDIYSRIDREASVIANKEFEEKHALISEENRKELTRLITAKN